LRLLATDPRYSSDEEGFGIFLGDGEEF
jgi:hypothetical protein